MKHAILITAYKNFEHLIKLVDFFDENFSLYIHVDKKSKNFDECQIAILKQKACFVSREYSVNWGGLNHLKSILMLSSVALRDKDISYFHLISGHDFPVKPLHYIKSFFETDPDKNYIDHCYPITPDNKMFLERVFLYNLYDIFNPKKYIGNKIIRIAAKIQKILRFKRNNFTDFPLYDGSTWWSLNRKTIEYVIDYTEQNKKLFNRFKYTFCSEEIYIQSLLYNSPYRDTIVNRPIHYIDWIPRNGNVPANLDETDLEKIKDSDCLFARKFEYPISEKLLNQIINLI